MALPSTQLQELRTQRGLEDEEIQVYHGRGAGRVVQRIARLAQAQRWEGACAGFGVVADGGIGIAGVGGRAGDRSPLDDGVEVVGHGFAGSRRQRLEARQARGSGGGRIARLLGLRMERMERMKLNGRKRVLSLAWESCVVVGRVPLYCGAKAVSPRQPGALIGCLALPRMAADAGITCKSTSIFCVNMNILKSGDQ